MSVLVYTENWDGKFKKLSYELVSYAKSVATMLGGDVTALSIGSVDQDELSTLGNYGASLVLSADGTPSGLDNQVYTSIIAAAMEKNGAKVLVMAHNNIGKAIAPRLSVRLKAGLAAAVTAVPESAGPLVVSKKVFSGKAFGKVEILTERAILTLSQNSFELNETGGTASVESFDPGVDMAAVKKDYGEILILVGNVDCGEILCQSDLEKVRAEVRRCMQQAKQGGRYILSDSNAIHSGCHPDAVMEMFRYAREIGKY